ncbi:hypothetical protein PR048_006765 [Dryococelus australis]|uniref:Uncharacterized protein n=1 Tax=Dryococelus australis TaxID=614101 RepID=A0ABQ9IBV6_9NEOP|nr:hypothetical protein PR048_006765 [Dryococelus australis]
MSPLKEAPWDMCVTERGNEEIQSIDLEAGVQTTPKVVKGTGEDICGMASMAVIMLAWSSSAGDTIRLNTDSMRRSLHVQHAPWLHPAEHHRSVVVRVLSSHLGEPGPIPGFSDVRIVVADATGRRIFTGISRSSHLCIPALPHTRLNSPLSPLNTSMSRAPARLPTRRSGFNSRPGHSEFSHEGILPDEVIGWRVFSGISRSPAPSFQHRSILTSIALIGSEDLDVERRPNLSTIFILVRGRIPNTRPQFYLVNKTLSIKAIHFAPPSQCLSPPNNIKQHCDSDRGECDRVGSAAGARWITALSFDILNYRHRTLRSCAGFRAKLPSGQWGTVRESECELQVGIS